VPLATRSPVSFRLKVSRASGGGKIYGKAKMPSAKPIAMPTNPPRKKPFTVPHMLNLPEPHELGSLP
jgi:hypothetical protein